MSLSMSFNGRILIRKLLPNSLLGRLIVVMFGSLLLAQVLGSLILFQSWGQQNMQHQGRYLAQRIVDISQALNQLPPAQHEPLLTALRSPRLRVHLSQQPPYDCQKQRSTVPFLRNLTQRLRQTLPDKTQCIQIETSDTGNLEVRVALTLEDGRWLLIEHSHPRNAAFSWSWRLPLSLLVMLGMISLSSWLAVRWFTQPLSDLAQAAEQLGRDIQQPPVPERGAIEVRQATRAFNTMQARLQRYLDDRTRILSAVSHDLKTPLTRMRLRAELIEEESLRENLCRDLEDMQAMTLATLDFLRGLDSREAMCKVDMGALLESLQADAEDLGWSVDLHLPDTLPPCWLRVNSIKRCLNNLIENGVKYGKAVTVRAIVKQHELCIDIEDQGQGIPETQLESVFEPFFRLENSRSRLTGGTGLGLSIARNLARAHGGEVQLSNVPQGGLLARVTLPILEDNEPAYNCPQKFGISV